MNASTLASADPVAAAIVVAATARSTSSALAQLEELLTLCKQRRASDVHITGGFPAYFRVQSELVPAGEQMLSPELVTQMAAALMSEAQRRVFAEQRQLDLAFFAADRTRYRVNAYQQRGVTALAIRRLDDEFRDLVSLNLPPQLGDLVEFPYGLVIVTGPTGSGKSTTLASMIHQINATRACHIITIEDPIEHVHKHLRSLIHQRELHCDVPSFASALKAALREDPDVLLVGEMRDFETIETALLAAETGHLVLSTLHTLDATETINRIVAVFPPHYQKQVRTQLASILKAVVSMRLMPRSDGKGRVPAVEVLITTPFIRDCIMDKDKTHLIPGAIVQGTSQYGMQSFDQSIFALLEQNLVSYEEAMRWVSNVDEFKLKIQGISTISDQVREDMAKSVKKPAVPAPAAAAAQITRFGS